MYRLSGGVVALAAAALWMAGPASAEPAAGVYTATVTQATPPHIVNVGQKMDVILTSCGPDCTKFMTSSETAWFGDLHLQGGSWTGPVQNAKMPVNCNVTLDDAAQNLVLNCPADGETVTYAMTKNA
jgi:hypothetical protein